MGFFLNRQIKLLGWRLTTIFPFLFFLLSCFVPCSYCSAGLNSSNSKARVLIKDADRCRKALYSSKKKKKYSHNWERCISKYQRVYKTYPNSKEAPVAMYRAARLYTGLYRYSGLDKNIEAALSLYERVVKNYKKHAIADDAQYRIGEIYYKYKRDLAKAYVEFLKVDIKFPSGDMRPEAKKMLDKIAVCLAKKEDACLDKNDETKHSHSIAHVKDIRHWSTPNYTRVVIDLDHPTKYKHNLLGLLAGTGNPDRLYVDLLNSKVSSEIDSQIPIGDGLLHRVRAGQYSSDTVRVVLDLASIGGYKIFHLYDPFRIVIDVKRDNGDKKRVIKPASRKTRHARKGIRRVKEPDRDVSLARQLGLNVRRVVIDPGHGGKDPGCYIGRGVREKDIVLKIAKILAKKMRKELGCEVFLTRTRDVFLPLERRTAIANMKKADLFISLHVNAHRKKWVHGLETYYLNMATDERAVLVAARENATSQKNISDLQTILNDLLLNTKIHESSRLAYEVQRGMTYRLKRRYRNVKSLGVKQAPFYVLIGAQMPAILIETGFLTNPTERKRLLNPTYEAFLAEGICKGVKRYIDSINQVYQGG